LQVDIKEMLSIGCTLLSCLNVVGLFVFAPILKLIGNISGREQSNSTFQINSVSVIVPAYNEEGSIAKKIETLAIALHHIDLNVEVIIGSDGSTDRTVEVTTLCLQKMNDTRWRLVEFPNEGKCKTLNKLVELACGDVIISTDADIPLPADSIELAVRAFQSNSMLGCLSCVPCFKGLNIGSQKSYWNIEDQIRTAESELGKLIVVTGMFYAYRKALFVEIPDGVMADDLWIPLNVLFNGFESVQVDKLRVPYEKTDEKNEVIRRKRVVAGGMDVVRRLWPQLVKSPSLLALVFFHKVNRWALPVWIMLLLCSLAGLWHWVILLYLVGVIVLFFVLGKMKFSTLVFAVFSPVLAFVDVLRSNDFARWEHTRKHL